MNIYCAHPLINAQVERLLGDDITRLLREDKAQEISVNADGRIRIDDGHIFGYVFKGFLAVAVVVFAITEYTTAFAGANLLEVSRQPKPISTRQGRPMTVWGNTWINAVLDVAINSDRPGDVTAHTSVPVRDSLTETQVLIPVGSTLHGMVKDSAASSINLNNNSIMVVWDSLVLPNGADIVLPKLPSADVDGLPGLSDKVNRHALQVWGPAILTSAITAAAMLSTTSTYGSYQGYSPESEALGQFGNSLGQKSLQNLNSMLGSVRPTIEVRKGSVIRILVREPGLPFDTAYEG